MSPDPRNNPEEGSGRAELPTFVIIGAAKSGTTSLHHYLDQHPEVFMSPVKETNFFTFCDGIPQFQGPWAKLLRQTSITDPDGYRRLFAAGAGYRARGEASPRYLMFPGTAERMHRHVPDAKLIAILRQPADAAFSAFMMRLRDGHEPRDDFRQAIEDERRGERSNWSFGNYRSRFFYYRQLSPYYAVFPREQIRVYLFEDLQATPTALFRDLFGFIGVATDFNPDTSVRLNRSGVIRNPVLRGMWNRSSGVRARVRPLLPHRLRRRAYQAVVRDLEKPRYDPALRSELSNVYREDILQLQDLIQRDLTAWLEQPEHGRLTPA